MQPLPTFLAISNLFCVYALQTATVEIANDVVHFGPVNGAFMLQFVLKPFALVFSGASSAGTSATAANTAH